MSKILRKISSHAPKRGKVARDASKRRLSKENNKQYNDFVRDVHTKIQDYIKEGAKRFNKPLGDVRNRIFTKTRLSHPKELVWQAYVHVRSKEINEGKAEGERKSLKEILKILAAEEDRFSERSDEEKAEWVRALQEHKADCDTQKRRDRKGEEIDHAHTINHLAHEMEAAEMRYGLQSFFMGVRSDAQQRIHPVILCSDSVKEFIALFMGKTPEQMVRMFELWAVNGPDGVLNSQKKSIKQLRSESRHFIQMKLNIILDQEEAVEMNYASYDTAIVARYGVRLVGWTYREFCNPGDITSKAELEKLHMALINKSCRWERVPQEERVELMTNAPPRKRQERSDKGKTRGPYKKRTSTAAQADKENAATAVPAAAKARALQTATKKKQANAAAAKRNAAARPAADAAAPAATGAARALAPAPVPGVVPAPVPAAGLAPAPVHGVVPASLVPAGLVPAPVPGPAPTPAAGLAPAPGPVPAAGLVPAPAPPTV